MTSSPGSGDLRTVRPLAEADIDVLQAIDTRAHGQAWSQRTFLDELDQANRVHIVAEATGEIVGHAAAWTNAVSGRITNVAVAPEHAGHGHATALLLELIDQLVNERQVANLQLEVRPANRRAQRMYSRFGFVPVGIERSFYDRSDERGSTDALVMAVADVCAEPWRQRLGDVQTSHRQVEKERNAGASA